MGKEKIGSKNSRMLVYYCIQWYTIVRGKSEAGAYVYKTLDSTPNTTQKKKNEIKMLLNLEEAWVTGRRFKMFLLVKASLFFLRNMM